MSEKKGNRLGMFLHAIPNEADVHRDQRLTTYRNKFVLIRCDRQDGQRGRGERVGHACLDLPT